MRISNYKIEKLIFIDVKTDYFQNLKEKKIFSSRNSEFINTKSSEIGNRDL